MAKVSGTRLLEVQPTGQVFDIGLAYQVIRSRAYRPYPLHRARVSGHPLASLKMPAGLAPENKLRMEF